MQDIRFAEIKGCCMTPTLSEKALVAFKWADFSDIRPQDIAVFKIKSAYMVHRVIAKFRIRGEGFFIHKGDAARIPLVAPSCALVGKAILEQGERNRPQRIAPAVAFKIILLKFKLWLKPLIAKA